MAEDKARVGIIMGSQSDWATLRHAAETLATLGIAHESRIVSAHRTPRRMVDYADTARDRGLKVIIAGAGGAAHLPGMVASLTPLPVFGVPVESKALSGRGVGVRAEHMAAIAQPGRRQGGHAAQLTATQDADHGPGGQRFARGLGHPPRS